MDYVANLYSNKRGDIANKKEEKQYMNIARDINHRISNETAAPVLLRSIKKQLKGIAFADLLEANPLAKQAIVMVVVKPDHTKRYNHNLTQSNLATMSKTELLIAKLINFYCDHFTEPPDVASIEYTVKRFPTIAAVVCPLAKKKKPKQAMRFEDLDVHSLSIVGSITFTPSVTNNSISHSLINWICVAAPSNVKPPTQLGKWTGRGFGTFLIQQVIKMHCAIQFAPCYFQPETKQPNFASIENHIYLQCVRDSGATHFYRRIGFKSYNLFNNGLSRLPSGLCMALKEAERIDYMFILPESANLHLMILRDRAFPDLSKRPSAIVDLDAEDTEDAIRDKIKQNSPSRTRRDPTDLKGDAHQIWCYFPNTVWGKNAWMSKQVVENIVTKLPIMS